MYGVLCCFLQYFSHITATVHMFMYFLGLTSNTLAFFLTLSKTKILDSSKLKDFAEDNFKVDENGGKFSKWIGNTVGKGEIARYEQFLHFPQCFQKTCTAHVKTRACLGKG